MYTLYNIVFRSVWFDRYYLRIIIRLANVFYPLFYLATRFLGLAPSLNQKITDRDDSLIVSITTFPTRINSVWLTIESILRQKIKPDSIILWLYEGEFNGIQSLPYKLRMLQKHGLVIRFCNDNLMPHKKYYYTKLNYPHSDIITIDDDVIYPKDLIQNFESYRKQFPNDVGCTIAKVIRYDDKGFLPYQYWDYVYNNTEPSSKYVQIGAGGVIYPKDTLHNDVLDIKVLKKNALKADDLWLKIHSLRAGAKVYCIGGTYPRFFIPLRIKNNLRLMDENIYDGNNLKTIQNLTKYYGLKINCFDH